MNLDFDVYALADKEESAIMLYRVGEEESFLQIDAVTPLIEEMVFTENGKNLFVYYMDDSAAVYDLETGVCVQEFKNFGDCLTFGVTSYNGGYAVNVMGGVYILNEKFEKIALLPSGAYIMPASEQFLLVDGEKIYSCPIYPIEKLIKKAEEIVLSIGCM